MQEFFGFALLTRSSKALQLRFVWVLLSTECRVFFPHAIDWRRRFFVPSSLLCVQLQFHHHDTCVRSPQVVVTVIASLLELIVAKQQVNGIVVKDKATFY